MIRLLGTAAVVMLIASCSGSPAYRDQTELARAPAPPPVNPAGQTAGSNRTPDLAAMTASELAAFEVTLHDRVYRSLAESPDLDASNLDVLVDRDRITLIGTVADTEQRALAYRIARSVPGVASVNNELLIR